MGQLLQALVGNKVTTLAGIGIIMAVVAKVLQGGELNQEELIEGLIAVGLMGARDGGNGSDTKASSVPK